MGIIAQVLSPWTIDAEGANVPALVVNHGRAGRSMMDVTGQAAEILAPDPNLVVIEVWDDSGVEDIEADGNYQLLWLEVVEDAII